VQERNAVMNPPDVEGVRVAHHYPVPAHRVFDAWLSPNLARRWMFATPTGRNVGCDIDAQVGGRFIIVDRRDGEDVAHNGEYLDIERPRRLVFQFAVPKYSSDVTRVTVEVATLGAGCVLTLFHDGVQPEFADRTRDGWTALLNGLDALLAGEGQARPDM
jgi:uncharacterized protein YndB with AHSA1/START domain